MSLIERPVKKTDVSGTTALQMLQFLNQSVVTNKMFPTGVLIHAHGSAQNHSSLPLSAIQQMRMLETSLLTLLNGKCAFQPVQKTALVHALGVTELSSTQRMTSALLELEPQT